MAAVKSELESWGLEVQVGQHVFDEWGYMAERDEDRLADLKDAFGDPAGCRWFAASARVIGLPAPVRERHGWSAGPGETLAG